jgi:hypothetical protein
MKDTYLLHLLLDLVELSLMIAASLDGASSIRNALHEDIAGDEVLAGSIDLIHEDRMVVRTRIQAVIGDVANGRKLDDRLLTGSLGGLCNHLTVTLAGCVGRVGGMLRAREGRRRRSTNDRRGGG